MTYGDDRTLEDMEQQLAKHISETTTAYIEWLEIIAEAERTGRAVGGFGHQPPPVPFLEAHEAVEAFKAFRPKQWWRPDDPNDYGSLA